MDSELTTTALKLVAVLGLVAANGFFVATEFSLVSVRKSRMESLVASGNQRAGSVLTALGDLDGYIAATQLGITISSIGLGWIGEPALATLLDPLFEQILPESLAFVSAHGVAFAIAFTIITVLHVVFGELAPKSVALQYPEQTSMAVAAPVRYFLIGLRPAIVTMNGFGRWVLKIAGLREVDPHQQVYTAEELEIIVTASTVGGELEDTEEEIIRRALIFADQTAEDVMVPRTEVVTLPADASLDDLRDTISAHPYSRFPVEGEDVDEILGILHVRDVLPILIGTQSARRLDLREIVRPSYVVPSTLPIDDLLGELKREGMHVAIAIDEYGGIAGIVTLEDIIERLVGEVPDEYGQPAMSPQSQDDGSLLLSGLMPVVDVNEHLDLKLVPTDTAKTLGGLMFAEIGREPKVGDTIETENYLLEITELDGLRISEVRATPIEAPVVIGELD
ncbi:MAG: hemolysin family protein [Thermomicrobiales bacterium]